MGLTGEALELHSLSGSSSVEWADIYPNQSLTWYKVRSLLLSLPLSASHTERESLRRSHLFPTFSLSLSSPSPRVSFINIFGPGISQATFDAPSGDEPLAMDMGSMGKGQVWINGRSIGRHWPAYKAHGSCPSNCPYAGLYNESKCQSNCAQPSQRWHVRFFPPSFLERE